MNHEKDGKAGGVPIKWMDAYPENGFIRIINPAWVTWAENKIARLTAMLKRDKLVRENTRCHACDEIIDGDEPWSIYCPRCSQPELATRNGELIGENARLTRELEATVLQNIELQTGDCLLGGGAWRDTMYNSNDLFPVGTLHGEIWRVFHEMWSNLPGSENKDLVRGIALDKIWGLICEEAHKNYPKKNPSGVHETPARGKNTL